MKKLSILFFSFVLQFTALVAQDDSVLEYAHLFPNCIDNQESTIYGGTYSEYPPEIEDAIFPGGGFVKMSQYIYSNTEMQPVYTGELNESGDSLLVIVGDSPVHEKALSMKTSRTGHVVSCLNMGGLSSKAKYS